MTKAGVRLVARQVLVVVAAGSVLGQLMPGRSTTAAQAKAPTAQGTPAGCADSSSHKATFVTVAPSVRLEVLDWGGTGETMVLLTGLGDNAHVYDQFASHFTDRFHVIGITRRGFGRSTQPADGYDLDTRARDDIAVLDALKIRRAVFVGHSMAGTELSKLAADYPDRVSKLVYLDALDIGAGGWSRLPQPPQAPELTKAEAASIQRLVAASARDDGYRRPLAATCNMVHRDPSGRIVGPVTPPGIAGRIILGLRPAEYDRIHVPALGIFNRISPRFRTPYYSSLKARERAEFDRSVAALSPWIASAIRRFRAEVKGSRVVELRDRNHYVYIVDEPVVVREMRGFLLAR